MKIKLVRITYLSPASLSCGCVTRHFIYRYGDNIRQIMGVDEAH